MICAHQLLACDGDLIRACLATWQRQWPEAGVLALLPEAEKSQVAPLQQLCRELSMPLAGAVFPALVTEQGFVTTGMWLVCLNPMPVTFLLTDIAEQGGQRLADAVDVALTQVPPGRDQRTLFMVFDGMVPNIGSLISDLQVRQGRTLRYAGVNAGSETFQPMPCLFDEQRVVGNGVLGMLVEPDQHIVVRHGYPVSRSLMKATSTTGNRIATIDNRPAFEVYREVVRDEYGVDLTAENFYEHAVHFPFGVVMIMDVLVRIPVALGDDGALFCVGEIPPDSMLRLLRAPNIDQSTCVDTLTEQLGPASPDAGALASLMTFYCAGRRMHFGAAATQELASLQSATGVQTLWGALTLGEIDMDEELGAPRFHNAALVCLRT